MSLLSCTGHVGPCTFIVIPSISLELVSGFAWCYQWIFLPLMYHLRLLISLYNSAHIQFLMVKVSNIQNKFHKGTYSWKCGLPCYRNSKCRSNFVRRLWDAFSYNLSKTTPFVLLTIFVYQSIFGWKAVDIFNFVSIFLHNVVQKVLRNLV